MAKYRITNFGATRKFPYNGISYEISHMGSIETDDRDIAVALDSFPFVDMEEIKAIPPKKVESKPEPELATEEEVDSSEGIVQEVTNELSKESDNDESNTKIKRRKIKEKQNE